jgi:pimeloyl-ACP methyl ester carboxylesterase
LKYTATTVLILSIVLVAFGCKSGSSDKPEATATPKPVPTPVEVRDEPQGVTLADPAFEALEGATADFGRLGGAVYQIEMPDDWNGRLLLYQHGFQELEPEAWIDMPFIRNYLIRNGWAWGASSYSSTNLIPGRAADETAALWDFFVEKYGRPDRTYVTGHSMGGAATNIAAERYADRYDGALQMCGLSSKEHGLGFTADYFVAAAYVAGVTQQEFDEAVATAAPHSSPFDITQADFLANPLFAVYLNKIKPVLDNPTSTAKG